MKIITLYALFSLFALAVNCQDKGEQSSVSTKSTEQQLMQKQGESIATFAGGCFWCTEAVFERVRGVDRVVSGYAGGNTDNPTYESIGTGTTGHAEAIQIYYDPSIVGFETLLEVFFLGAHDPTQVNRQGPDVGTQYRSIAFYRSNQEKEEIENYIKTLEGSNKFERPIATEIKEFEIFYPAEDYHQDYYPAHPGNPYIQQVTKPKVEKFEKNFNSLLK